MNVPACDHTQNGPAPNRRFFLVKCRQCSYEQIHLQWREQGHYPLQRPTYNHCRVYPWVPTSWSVVPFSNCWSGYTRIYCEQL